MIQKHTHLGQLTQVTDDAGTRTIGYNAFGEQETDSLMAGDITHLITETRDTMGRSTGYTYAKDGSTQQTVTTGYGTDGRITTAGFMHGGAEKQFGYGYLPGSDLLQSLTLPCNMTLTQSYETQRNLLTSMAYRRGSTLVAQRTYTYDSLGRPLTRSTARNNQTVTDSFGYNTRSELTSATVNNGSYGYAYDNIGNRTTAQENAEEITSYQSNALNQYAMLSVDDITDFVPEYDAAGNQTRVKTSTGIWAISYDAENRPTDFTKVDSSGSTSIHCEYDHMGRRATKKVTTNGSISLHQRYLYRGYLQIAACDLTRSGHPCLWFITWDPTQSTATRPLAIRKDGTWFAYGWDLTKNICEVFGPAGYIRTAYTYTPYGEGTSSGDVEQPLQWSSEFNDEENGLLYYNYRHYNAKDGRWLTRDASEETSGLNLYSFTHNNSITKYDILGLQDDKCCKDGKQYKEISDDAGRNCCEYELQEIAILVEPHGNYFKTEVGHAWVQTPNMQLGFYPNSWHCGLLGAGEGIVKNDDSTQIPAEDRHTPNPRNSYYYKACPESIKELEENMTLSKQAPPEYSLYNNGNARNCCGWACEMVEKSGFVAPFAPNTVTLAPAAPGHKGYGPGRKPKK